MKKIIIPLLIGILLLSIAYADECLKTMNPNQIPCQILLPDNNSKVPCNTINLSVSLNSTLQYTQLMGNLTNSMCNATFTRTSFGTYTFQFSTGDTGSLTISEDINNRYYLYIVALIIFIFLMWLGYYLKDVTPITISGFLVVIIGISIFLNGFPNLTSDFLKNSVAVVLIGIGFYFVVAPNIEWIEELF